MAPNMFYLKHIAPSTIVQSTVSTIDLLQTRSAGTIQKSLYTFDIYLCGLNIIQKPNIYKNTE